MKYQPRTLTDEQIQKAMTMPWIQDLQLGNDRDGKPVWTLDLNRVDRPIVHGIRGDDWHTYRFGLPGDMSGLGVLEVGCADGLFSFEAASRGANVLATDVDHKDCFALANELRGSEVAWRYGDIQDRSTLPKKKHDVVMCFGVLYHLTNPLIALVNLRRLTGGYLLLETAGCQEGAYPCWRVYEEGCEGDPGNFWYPNYEGLRIALGLAGFKHVEKIYSMACDFRFTVKAW